MNERKTLEKWIKQIKAEELNPEFIGLGPNKDQAIKKLQSQLEKQI